MSGSLQPHGLHPPGSSVHGISQVRILGWVAISSFRGSSQTEDQTHVSFVSCIASGFFTNSVTCDGSAIGSLKSLSDSRFSWTMMKNRQVKLEELRNNIQLLPSAYYSHIYSFIRYSIQAYQELSIYQALF